MFVSEIDFQNSLGQSETERVEILHREGRLLFVRTETSSNDEEVRDAWLVTRSELEQATQDEEGAITKDFEWLRMEGQAFDRLGPDYRWYVLRLAVNRLTASRVTFNGKPAWYEETDTWTFFSAVDEFSRAVEWFSDAALQGPANAYRELLANAQDGIQRTLAPYNEPDVDFPLDPVNLDKSVASLLQATAQAIDITFPTDNGERFNQPPKGYGGSAGKFESDLVVYILCWAQKSNAEILAYLSEANAPYNSVNTIAHACKRIVERLKMPPAPNRSGRPSGS